MERFDRSKTPQSLLQLNSSGRMHRRKTASISLQDQNHPCRPPVSLTRQQSLPTSFTQNLVLFLPHKAKEMSAGLFRTKRSYKPHTPKHNLRQQNAICRERQLPPVMNSIK
eukprot:TRINITY_DN8836_c0_g1_i1.p2 TRINITY_DN8836_c0_g1~~TRINITY_DN8836_c0_g1_i1.p2  ORF type:complete len:111 (-),score=5.29 TRINITY_DN8836_c0_g1_i1:428-760(-)